MSEALSLASPLLGIGTGIMGLNQANQQQQYQNQVRNLQMQQLQNQQAMQQWEMNPQNVSAYAKGFTQPLVAGLQEGVGNATQGQLAERGLSTSPSIANSVMSQAIAPYVQQEQNTGQQAALQALSGINGMYGAQNQVLNSLQNTINPNLGSGAMSSIQYGLKGLGSALGGSGNSAATGGSGNWAADNGFSSDWSMAPQLTGLTSSPLGGDSFNSMNLGSSYGGF